MTQKYIATDLDRTLIQNGTVKKEPQAYKRLQTLLKKHRIPIIFVTGRRLTLVEQALKRYPLPQPEFIICSVGTKIYQKKKRTFRLYQPYQEKLAKEWSVDMVQKIQEMIDKHSLVKPQSPINQNEFKISYFVEKKDMNVALARIKRSLKNIPCQIVDSQDETKGFIDILAPSATKLGAMEFLRKKLKIHKKNMLYCGDSGNDLQPMLANYPSVLVKNATKELKERVSHKKNIYVAQGTTEFSGNYTSGIIEGAYHHSFFQK
ncbi:MAG: HAD-IIB family hydrolase [Candidatus Woesearchaeota archaeon]